MKRLRYTVAFVAFCTIVLGGCKPSDFDPSNNWLDAPENYTCTEAQMVKVQRETDYCGQSSGYRKAYCYSAAIMRNCQKKAAQ
jgi:hypothetical protein